MSRGTWVAHLSVRLLVLAQVVISQFVRWSPVLGLCAESMEPAWDPHPHPPPPRPLSCSHSHSQSKLKKICLVKVYKSSFSKQYCPIKILFLTYCLQCSLFSGFL